MTSALGLGSVDHSIARSKDGTATLSGTPTSTKHKSAMGTYPLTFTATFGRGKSKVIMMQAFTLTVDP